MTDLERIDYGINPVYNVTFQNSEVFNKVKCEPGWEWNPMVSLPDYDLWYAYEGKGEMRLNGEVYPITKGSCFVIHPGDRPHAVQDQTDRLAVIFIHFRTVAPDLSKLPDLPRHTFIRDTYYIERLLHELLHVLRSQLAWKAEEFDCWMKLVMLYLCRYHADKEQAALLDRHNGKVRMVIDYIQRESGRRIQVDELASLVGISKGHLNHLFKQYTGVTLKKYITRTRLERAKFLLADTTMNISQVAETLGYADIYAFSKMFKQYFRMTPSYYQYHSRETIRSNKSGPKPK